MIETKCLDVVVSATSIYRTLSFKDICHVSNWSAKQRGFSGIPLFRGYLFLFHELSLQ